MARSTEWFIGGILVLIVGIVIFLFTKNTHALIAPVLLFLFGVYKKISGK